MASLPGAFFEKGRSFLPCLFNSFDPYFKQPFGAVRAGQSVHLSLCIPEELGYVDPHLVLQKEGRYDVPVHYRMKFDGQTPHQNHFSVDVTLNDVGLYFYYFDLYTDFRRIVRGPDNCGVVSWQEGESWQITVYEADFETPAPIKGKVFYQIFPDRFCEGIENKPMPFPDRLYQADKHAEPFWQPNETGGHLNEDYFGGDLKGIEEKLGYLESLGVTCIYLNPIFSARSNHRYDTGDYMKIDPMLGTEEDFKSLCKSAEEYGIKILLDGVFSHTGADSRYFDKFSSYGGKGAYCDKNSPYRSWYNFRCWPDDYACWWGVDILPELNETDPGVLAFLTGENGVARHWLRLGASGWRLDVADELPDEFLDRFHEAVRKEKKDAFIYGEVWEDATDKISYGHHRRYLEGGELDSVMNYPFANAVIDFVRTANAEELRECVENIVEHYPRASLDTLMNHIGTHDTVRAITRLGRGDIGRPENGRDRGILTEEQYQKGVCLLKLASVLQFTLPGVPCVYYGDEAGLAGGEDPFNRACFPWGKENAELLGHYRTLGRIRKLCPAFIDGEFNCISSALGCIAYERNSESGSALIIANANCHGIEYTVPERWRGASTLFGSAADGLNVPLGAYSAAILYK